jgi:hypothetical protein
MAFSPDYRSYKVGQWRLWVRDTNRTEQLWRNVVAVIETQPYSRHPQVLQLRSPNEDDREVLYLKLFHGSVGLRKLRDIFRSSKALRSARQAAALAECNFHVPIPLAAGENRKYRVLRKAFVLMAEVEGESLPVLLREQQGLLGSCMSQREKRLALADLAAELRRLHALGFVHGDLVATNIFVCPTAQRESRFIFMDNDRTRRYPKWLPQTLWRRNLVQLNRMPLPGITLQDRVRFLAHYLQTDEWGPKERRLLSWLERKTRQRRRQCDAVDSRGSFRQLMRWDGTLA